MMKANLLFSAAIGAIALASPALAEGAPAEPQPASARSAEADGTIVVTARRREEDISTVPISITAVSGATLQSRNIVSLTDFTKLTPGLNVSIVSSGRFNPFVVIRGQSRAVTGNVSPGVITYLNDVPLPNNASVIQAFDMANIQVLKGPQGTLFGRNSIGGAILTNTKAPTHDFGGYAKAEVAQYGTYSLEGAINLPIVHDAVALRIAGQYRRDGTAVNGTVWEPFTIGPVQPDGSIVATPGKQILNPRLNPGEFETTSFRASLLIQPTDWLKNTTVVNYMKVRGVAAPLLDKVYTNGLKNDGNNIAIFLKDPAVIESQLTSSLGATLARQYASIVQQLARCPQMAINCNVFAAQAAYEGKAVPQGLSAVTRDPYNGRAIFKTLTNTTVVDLGSQTQLKNILGLVRVDYYGEPSLSGLPIPFYMASGTNALEEQFTDELQLSGSLFENQLKYTVGGFYYNERPVGHGGIGSIEQNTFLGLSHIATSNWLHNRSKAIYGQFDYSPAFLPNVTLTAGGRQTWDEQSTCATTRQFSPINPGSALLTTNPDELDALLPSEAACKANSGLKPSDAGYTLTGGTTAQNFPTAKFKKFTYTLGAQWQITPNAMTYVTHRRGYRAGGYNVPQMDPYLASIQTFNPETLTDWEVGAKLKFRSGDVRGGLNFALFTGKDKGNQLPVSVSNLGAGPCIPAAVGSAGRASNCVTIASQTAYTPGTPGVRVTTTANTVSVNAADLTIRGFEADANISPTNWLTLMGGVGYVESKVDRISLDPSLAELLTAAGRVVPAGVIIQGQPKWTLTGSVLLQSPTDVLGGHLSAALDYRHNSSFQVVELIVPGTTYFDLNISLDQIGGTGVSLSAYVKNLFDQTIYPGASASSPSALGYSTYLFGSNRTFGLTATYKFGAQ